MYPRRKALFLDGDVEARGMLLNRTRCCLSGGSAGDDGSSTLARRYSPTDYDIGIFSLEPFVSANVDSESAPRTTLDRRLSSSSFLTHVLVAVDPATRRRIALRRSQCAIGVPNDRQPMTPVVVILGKDPALNPFSFDGEQVGQAIQGEWSVKRRASDA